jgi:hypothetical protein
MEKIESYFREQVVIELEPRVGEVLRVERANFSTRINSLCTWALLILHETH